MTISRGQCVADESSVTFLNGCTETQSPLFREGRGLLSYGANVPALFRRSADYVDKILKGGKPADLPVEEPTQYRMFVNLKTARMLGLTIPPLFLPSQTM